MKTYNQFNKINEIYTSKVSYEFDGKKPFIIDENGKLLLTMESYGKFYLTYDQYKKLEDLSNSINKKCLLLDEKKKTTIEILTLAVRKVANE